MGSTMTNMGGREGKSKAEDRERAAVADLQEEMRREAEAHFRWAREAKLRREAENRARFSLATPPTAPPPPVEASPQATAETLADVPPVAPPAPAAEAPIVEAPRPTEAVPTTEAVPSTEALPPTAAPAVHQTPAADAAPAHDAPAGLSLRAAALTGLQPSFESQWQQLERNRRDLLAEWARLSKARERIEATYERLDDLREQLDAERRQLERQREHLWMGRFQLASESERAEPRPVAADRPWRDVGAHLLEAAVVVRAAVALQTPRLIARLRGRASRGALTGGRRRALPPGS